MKQKANAGNPTGKKKDSTPSRVRRERWQGYAIELYLMGYSQEMVRQLMKEKTGGHSFSIKTINAYINEAVRDWRQKKDELIDSWKAEQLEKINMVEAQAWEGWQRSIGIVLTTNKKQVKGDSGTMSIIQKNEQGRQSAGDPRFLDLITKCIEQRCKILGVETPVIPPQPNGNAGNVFNFNRRVVFKGREIKAVQQITQDVEKDN